MKSFRKLLAALLVPFYFHFAATSKVEFYESENFIGLIAERSPSEECINLPRLAYDKTSSIKTDSCVMMYKGENCSQTSIEIRPGSYSNLANVTHAYNQNFVKSIRSFHQCREYVGSSGKLNVTFYEDQEIIVEYQNICGCITLPDLTNRVTRLDNHGTCLKLYTSPIGLPSDCTGSYHTILGGTSYISENLRNITHTSTSWKRIAAISPCSDQLTKCVKLQATVVKFEIDSDPKDVSVLSSSSDISMSTTTTLLNNGSALVSEEYTATKSIIEATETTLVKGYTSMDSWTVEMGITTEFTANIPFVSKTTVTASLTSAYTIEETSSWEESATRRKETSTEFSVCQRIELEPCTRYNVNSFVRMVHNYPVNYKVYSQVRGWLGDRQLSAAEVKEQLESLVYVGDHDNYTVIAMGQGSMVVDFGVETLIDGEGAPIEGCPFYEDNRGQGHNQLKLASSAEKFSGSVMIFILSIFIPYLNNIIKCCEILGN